MRNLTIIAAGVVALAASGSAHAAALLVDFKPVPSPSGIPELRWSGGALEEAFGAVGDGGFATAGGLQIETPFNLSLPGDPVVGPYAGGWAPSGSGSTLFYDVTLNLTDISSAGPALTVPLGGGMTHLFQFLTEGEFELLSYDPAGVDGPVLLLAGTIADANINGRVGVNSADFKAFNVTYTDGIIYDALASAIGAVGPISLGEASISLLPLTGVGTSASTTVGLSGGQLRPFDASITGQFSTPIIPEPSAAALLAGVPAFAMLRRVRRA